MKINHNNPNIQLQNILGLEQAARKEAAQKAAESARAHAAEEAVRLQGMADSVKKAGDGQKKNPGDPSKQGRRNARYLPDGTIEPDGPDTPESPAGPPLQGGIDFRA